MLTEIREARLAAVNPGALLPAATSGLAAMGASGQASQVNRAKLLRAYTEIPWVRLAGDIVAARQTVAEWSLLLPRRGAGRMRLQRQLQGAATRASLDPLGRAEVINHIVRDAVASGDFKEFTRHPFLDMQTAGTIGGHPMLAMSGHEVDRLERITIDLWGEFYYWIARDSAGIPRRWWPLPPAAVRKPRRAGDPFEIGAERVPAEDVAFYRQPRPEAPYGDGAGVAEALQAEVQIDRYAADYLSALLRNRARPDLLIMAPGLGETERERFETAWRQDLQGGSRSGVAHFIGIPQGPAVGGTGAGRGIVVHDLARSPADLQMDESRKARRDLILQVWRVPQDVVGATESSNRSTAYQAEVFIRRNRTVPDLESRRNWLQQRFFEPFFGTEPEFPGGWVLVYKMPSLDDPELRASLLKDTPYIFDQNELREAAGEQPVDGGEGLYYMPDNIRATRDPEEPAVDSLTTAFTSGAISRHTLHRLAGEEEQGPDVFLEPAGRIAIPATATTEAMIEEEILGGTP